MAVVEDWTKEAAKELYEFGEPHVARTPDQDLAYLRSIIIKHCPFKPDTVYWEAPTRERIDTLVALLHEAHNGSHSRGYNDESCDYPPCPKSDEDASDDAQCTCGAGAWNARVDAALVHVQR